MQSIEINNCNYVERRKKKNCSLYRGYKLFLSKVVRVNCNVAIISFFKINILLFSESIQFGAEITRVEYNDKIEL